MPLESIENVMSEDDIFCYKPGSVFLAYNRHQNNGRTERAVEIPIAEYWFGLAKEKWPIVEVGCVLPYFWPRWSHEIVDPVDTHATVHGSLFSGNYTGKAVVSISTLEHVDDSRYGLPLEGKTPYDAYVKIRDEAEAFLVTVPYGWEQGRREVGPLQQHLLTYQKGIYVFVLLRDMDDHMQWHTTWETDGDLSPYSYGPHANAVIIAEKGGLL